MLLFHPKYRLKIDIRDFFLKKTKGSLCKKMSLLKYINLGDY
jgi:hypothetical protein